MTKKTPSHSNNGYEIYLMRHGIAADRDPSGSADDSKRPLTAEGKLKLRASAKGLKRLGVDWDWIVSSPLKRAVETADVVAEELETAAARDLCEALAPEDGSAQKLISFLSQYPDRASVLLVGHNPSIGELASELIGANRDAGVEFKKGGCCLITYNEFPTAKTSGDLAWLLTPRVLRKMGG
ncbi:MAG: phosphohistidine phosphatase SixA [Terriglobia bacterium]